MQENIICHWIPVEWWVNEFPKELEKTNTHHIVLLPQEVLPYKISLQDLYIFDEILKENESRITFYSGAELKVDFERIKFEYWPSFYYFSSAFREDDSVKDKPKFTSLTHIKSGRQWRHYLFEKLFDKDLIDRKYTIFHKSTNYDSKIIESPEMEDTIINQKHHLPTKPTNEIKQGLIHNFYMSAAIDIVCETSTDTFFPTEKTTRPIFCKKPFLVLGCKDYHEKLYDEFGIEKFEIFDYSYEKEKNLKERIDKYVDELKRINASYTFDYIIESTSQIISRNFIKLMNITQIDYKPENYNNIFWEHVRKQ